MKTRKVSGNSLHNSDSATLESYLSAAIPLLTSFLAASETVYLALLTPDGTVRFVNPALSKCLKTSSAELVGQSFTPFVTGPDGVTLARILAGQDICSTERLLLNLVDSDQIPHTICCRFVPADDGYLLFGEPPQDDNQTLQEELLQLNNQLTVLSRENVRKGRELAKALADLKSTQALLVHQEKMASLGQMTAGIAHEINNPLAFVLGNEQVLKRDFGDLMAFINTLGDALPEIATLSPRLHAEIVGKAGDVGLEYLAEAVPRKIAANIDGLERVKDIVLDLRNFSRLDEAERKLCNLEEGIEAMLRFMGPVLHEHGVTVETVFAPLPKLLCSPGPLNQAISNVLVNAIQASSPGQTVRISTSMRSDRFCIEVTDHGCGIPPENMAKVFDPFFTTKPVGSGTGLGLSITHQIVEAHKGRIEIDSIPDSGTTIRFLLPKDNREGASHGTQ